MHSRLVINAKPSVYGWSVVVDFTIDAFGGISECESEPLSILWDEKEILLLEPRQIHPELSAGGAKGYRLKFEGALTACSAENAGIRLSYAILRIAEKRLWGLHLSWPDAPLPCRVIDRTASRGAESNSFASVSHRVSLDMFVDELETAFKDFDAVPYELLMSLELSAAARFQNNSRARFVLLVSALETLAVQEDLSDQISTLIGQLESTVEDAGISDNGLRQSILGQVRGLRRESVRRALKRRLKTLEVEATTIRKVDEAYQTRSKILHEGARVPELEQQIGVLNQVLAKVYQKLVTQH